MSNKKITELNELASLPDDNDEVAIVNDGSTKRWKLRSWLKTLFTQKASTSTNENIAVFDGTDGDKIKDGGSALGDFIKKDGSVDYTGDQSMNENKLTNVADGTDSGDAVNRGQLDEAGGGLNWITKSDTYTAEDGEGIVADTSTQTWTLTLPENPEVGEMVGISDAKSSFEDNSLMVDRNGEKIQGQEDDLEVNLKDASFMLVYNGADTGWKLDTYLQVGEFSVEEHSETHQDGGADEINVGGLSGELADEQKPKDHDNNAHSKSFSYGVDDEEVDKEYRLMVAEELPETPDADTIYFIEEDD